MIKSEDVEEEVINKIREMKQVCGRKTKMYWPSFRFPPINLWNMVRAKQM